MLLNEATECKHDGDLIFFSATFFPWCTSGDYAAHTHAQVTQPCCHRSFVRHHHATLFLLQASEVVCMLLFSGSACGFVLVAVLWGCTNPFLKRASEASSKTREPSKEQQHRRSCCGRLFGDLLQTMKNWQVDQQQHHVLWLRVLQGEVRLTLLVIAIVRQFFVPFVLNQSGSVVYYYLLGTMGACAECWLRVRSLNRSLMLPLVPLVASEVSLAVPICNSLAFAFTAVTAYVLGERGILNACTRCWVMVQQCCRWGLTRV